MMVLLSCVAVVSSTVVRVPHLLSERTIVGIREERIHRRTGVRDGPLPLVPCALGRRRGPFADVFRQPREVGFGLEEERMPLLVGEEVLAELCRERCEVLVDLGDARLLWLVEL